MGTDKGLLQQNGKTWAATAYDKLTDLGIPVFISIHPTQQQTYQSLFPELTFITDNLPLRGPLAALLSAHQQFPQTDWIILPCDLPDMQLEVLTMLRQYYAQLTDHECFVFENEGEPEPLCGIYKAVGVQKIFGLFQQNALPKHSMKYVLDICRTHRISLTGSYKTAFQNYNTPEDLKRGGFGF